MPEHHGDLFSVVVMAFRRKRQYEETEEPRNTRCRSPCSRPCTRRHFLAALACKTEERVISTLWYSANCDRKLHPDVAPRCTYVVTTNKSFWGYGILIRVFAFYVSRGHGSEIIKLLAVRHGQLRHA